MGDSKFARPVHGLVMMHGRRTIRGRVMDIESSNRTLGHRVLARGPIRLAHADDYEAVLREQGKVLADFAERRAAIAGQLERRAGGAQLVAGEALLDEITSLVEAPAVHAGKFDPAFLEVPQECLILSMQQHQRYVPLRDRATGELAAAVPVRVQPAGEECARDRARQRARAARAPAGREVFLRPGPQDPPGEPRAAPRRAWSTTASSAASSSASSACGCWRARSRAGSSADFLRAEQAAWLSKADLLTEMVGEFPELQGIMGRYYALHDGETEEVADAIADHYRPRYAGDALPEGNVAIAVALADKLYTLAGLFGIGQVPTGDRDPFGLRRAALGVIRILIERDLPLSLHDLVTEAFAVYDRKIADAHTELHGVHPRPPERLPEGARLFRRWRSNPCWPPDSTA